MAYCAPRQLSSCLPIVVQHLRDTLHDTHPEVASAAFEALKRVGGVVANPEIAPHVPTLLKAIQNPDLTDSALDSLMYTRIVHSVDAPALAILMPVLFRGLKGREISAKKKAAQVYILHCDRVLIIIDCWKYVIINHRF
jgi:hypothetical protein